MIRLLAILTFCFLNFSATGSSIHLKLNNIEETKCVSDTSRNDFEVYYNSDSATKKGINTKTKTFIRKNSVTASIGMLLIAAAINGSNNAVAKPLAIASLGLLVIAGPLYFKQIRISDSELANKLLGKNEDEIKKMFGEKLNYQKKYKDGIPYLEFNHITVIKTYDNIKNIDGNYAGVRERKTKYFRLYEAYFDEKGLVNFARFRYYKSLLTNKWRESKRIKN